MKLKSEKKWKVLGKLKTKDEKLKVEDVVDVLLKDRGIKTKKQKEEFFKPTKPDKISVSSLDISKKEINKTIKRLQKAKEKKEKIVIYGDYDADGICATAILWECLYNLGFDVTPHIPDRFEEGYGLNVESIQKLKVKSEKLKVIITVDNGIVAYEAVDTANKLGIDVIVTDHHLPHTHVPRQRKRSSRGKGSAVRGKKERKLPKAHSIIHTTVIGGAGIAWFLARELNKRLSDQVIKDQWLELAAIGTIADQLPLLEVNRSLVKYGLEKLNNTKRTGLLELFREARLEKGNLETYEVGYIIAPRINAMGRLEHGIDSLRLLCTINPFRARGLATKLGKTNKERRKIVEKVVLHANEQVAEEDWQSVVVIAHESYHEGVIGLVASKLVEKYYRPAIVLYKGEELSKASARSISGFSIIKVLRKMENLMEGVGGHDMAAGFTIKTDKIEKLIEELTKVSKKLLTKEILSKSLKVDFELPFKVVNEGLISELEKFEPTGVGNPIPSFVTKKVNVLDARTVGFEGKHLKLKLEKEGTVFNAIAFGLGDYLLKLSQNQKCDIVYSPFRNSWRGYENIELKVKDIKV